MWLTECVGVDLYRPSDWRVRAVIGYCADGGDSGEQFCVIIMQTGL